MGASKKAFALAVAIGMTGVAQAEPQCSTQDKVSLAKSGYSKKEIDAICAKPGSTNSSNADASAKPASTVTKTASKADNSPLVINGKTGMDAHEAYQRNDFVTARKIAEPLAQAGDPVAMRTLGRMRDTGNGLRKDERESASWYRKAADKGDGWAMYNLSIGIASGQGGLRKDLVEAEALAKKAVAAGFSNGYNAIANARIVAGDQKGYTDALSRGVEAGAVWAIEQRGYDLVYGDRGAVKDVNAGIAMLEKAVAGGEKSAALFLAQQYHSGHNGFPKDKSKSFKWFTKAAELHSVDAMLPLSGMLEDGEDVPKNQAEADKWQRKAAESGDPRAAWFEAEALRKQGRDQEAERFYLASAYGGNEMATYQLGYLYGSSDSIRDYFKAAYWYLISLEIEPIIPGVTADVVDRKRETVLESRKFDELRKLSDSVSDELARTADQLDKFEDKLWDYSAQTAAIEAQEKVVGLLLQSGAPINALDLSMNYTDISVNRRIYRAGSLQAARTLKLMRDQTGDKSYLPQAISAQMMANLSTSPTPEITAMATDFGDAEEALRIAAAISEKRLRNATFKIVARSFDIHSDSKGKWDASKALMDQYGVTVDSTPSYEKTTLLHMAVWNGNSDAAKKLVELGADINAKDSDGDTPLDYALEEGHEELDLADWLEEKGAKRRFEN